MFYRDHAFQRCIALCLIALFLAGGGAAQTRIIPSEPANQEGNSENDFPFNLAARYQQVYAASAFGNGTGKLRITHLTFRPDTEFGNAFTAAIDSMQVRLSTTTKTPETLSVFFADNLGTDETLVFNGKWECASQYTGPAIGPKAFDIVLKLTTPFVYDPTQGNLLLDVRNSVTGKTTAFDMERSNDAVARVFSSNLNSAFGTMDTGGLITRFTYEIAGVSVSGVITLKNSVNMVQPITLTFRPQGKPAFNHVVTLGADGSFTVPDVPPALYQIHIKGSNWLAKNVNRDASQGDVSGVTATLIGGDANSDNAVDIFDLGTLAEDFNSLPGDGNWNNGRSDFNNDGSVDIFDLAGLAENFNLQGDP